MRKPSTQPPRLWPATLALVLTAGCSVDCLRNTDCGSHQMCVEGACQLQAGFDAGRADPGVQDPSTSDPSGAGGASVGGASAAMPPTSMPSGPTIPERPAQLDAGSSTPGSGNVDASSSL